MKDEKKVTGKEAPAKKKKHVSALTAAAVGRSATAQVRPNSGSDALATTGTNVSYEGATAPGGGGSVGTGYASGQSATGAALSTDTEQDEDKIGAPAKKASKKK